MPTKEKALRVAALRVRNILGIEQAEIRPGRVTLIEGANGKGKTSLLEAFRSVLSGGHDATLLRKGHSEGEIVMVLDDGQEIRRDVNEARSSVTITHPELGEIRKPRTVIDRLVDSFALNPVDFLTAKKETRLQLLLAAIPLKVSPRDLSATMKLTSLQPSFEAHALPVLSLLEKDIYDQRTGVNRVAKEQRTTAKEMEKALPVEVSGANPAATLAELRQDQSTFLKGVAAASQKIRDLADVDIETAQAKCEREIEQARATLAERRRTIEADQARAQSDHAASVRDQDRFFVESIATLEAAASAHVRTKTTREHLQKLAASAEKAEAKSQQLTDALAEIEEVRGALVEELPIKGLSIVDGEIQIDGISFDRLNESRRVRLACEVAMMRAGALPLLAVDGIERLDASSIAELESFAEERDVQLILARVTEGPLKVTVVE